ncbi:Outer membrane protein beta-barrel domain-containing protein [Lishizhenia tianjinensis]|uniref:Outer membrane protein beta-barrel domain-containing protein n=1 Tax=Lishizhenia tianjinensis TaxID=477690 RepID=A0A1I7BRY6_9FLAO|nr:outer membrane beta-barrel protein [Lishizhenia tianjinensis]SFT89957.1 Outer membrane protein beta-barrel domain-containing protein [Lishizhenia tianjinensis]
MKKIFTIAAVFLGFCAMSQEAEVKKLQAGISLSEGILMNQSETNLISSPGVGNNFGIGVNLHYMFAEYLGFSTGIIFDIQQFRYTVNTTTTDGEQDLFYMYKDRTIYQRKNFVGEDGMIDLNTTYDGIFRLDERQHRPIFLTIPTMLTFHTKYYGYTRYFGRAGLRNSFIISNRANDTGMRYELNPQNQLVPTGEDVTTMNDMEPQDEINFYQGALGLSGGVEWKFSGNVSLVGEVAYYHGFTPMFKGDAVFGSDDKNKSLFNQNNDNSLSFRSFDAKQRQLMLKVSILF